MITHLSNFVVTKWKPNTALCKPRPIQRQFYDYLLPAHCIMTQLTSKYIA